MVKADCLPVAEGEGLKPLFPEISQLQKHQHIYEGKDIRFGQSRGISRYGDDIRTSFVENKPIAALILQQGLGLLIEEEAEPACVGLLKLAQKLAITEKKGMWSKAFKPNDKALEGKIGTNQLIYGRVFSVKKAKSGHYVNFYANYRENLSAFVKAGVIADIEGLAGKTIYLQGLISKSSGLSVTVEKPSQIFVE